VLGEVTLQGPELRQMMAKSADWAKQPRAKRRQIRAAEAERAQASDPVRAVFTCTLPESRDRTPRVCLWVPVLTPYITLYST
jgi:hypothetical protein